MEQSPVRIAGLLGDLARQMQAERDTEATLKTIVEATSRVLPGISWAGISMVRGKKVVPRSPTDEVARALDELQSELGEGPALSALADEKTIAVPDLTVEMRWPRFVAAATQRGVECLWCFRLFVQDEVLGALTMYGPQRNMVTDESIEIGEAFAQHAAVALAGALAEEQMKRAIANRDVIGQAKGLLMQRENLTGLQAFAILTRASQDTNIKVVDVAKFFVDEFEQSIAPAAD